MRKVVAGLVLAGVGLGLAACGSEQTADGLLTRLDTDARIVCLDKQVSTTDGIQTTSCDGFTVRIYESREQLEEETKKGNPDPTITGHNWQISAPDLQMANKIRSTVGGHLVVSIAQNELPQEEPRR